MDLELRQKALDFATKYHKGQKRKDGKDYITHPIAVADIAIEIYDSLMKQYFPDGEVKPSNFYEQFRDELYVASLLHDTIEDTEATKRDIELGFGYGIAYVVDCLSRKEGQTYFDFIMRLVREYDFLPIYVKMADLKHNMSDLNEGSLKDKYRFAYQVLSDTIEQALKDSQH